MVTDRDFIYDLVFDPDDVDIEDYMELTLTIHGTLTPQVNDYLNTLFPGFARVAH